MTTKKLRNKILDLAIHGRLVKQDPNDEPASALLARIRAEKEQLVKEGKLKKKDLVTTPVSDEDKPFEVPEGWEWCRLGEICSTIGDGLHGTPAYDSNGDYYFINGNNLNEIIELKADTKRTTEEEFQKQGLCFDSQTVFVSINGTIGNVAFYNNEKIVLGKSACYINLIKELCRDYIAQIIKSKYFLKYATESATGSTIKNVPLAAVRSLPIPLPPLAEQHRIVAAVEQWMSLIDVIESGQENLQQSIALAKNKILDLAIKGKLVEKEGEWEEKTLGEVCSFESGLAYSSDKYVSQGTPLIRISNIIDGSISLANCVYINECDYPRHFYVENGDLLIAMSGATTGKMGIYQNENRAVLNQRVGNIKIKDHSILHAGFRNLIMEGLKPIIEEIAYGGAQPNISSKMICALTFPLPPLAEQHRIVAKIEELFAQLDNIANALK